MFVSLKKASDDKKEIQEMVTFKGAGKDTEWTLIFYEEGFNRSGFGI